MEVGVHKKRMRVFCVVFTLLISTVRTQSSSTVPPQEIDCIHNFTGPADIIFLLDASASIGGNNFETGQLNLKSFLDSFIRKVLLVGPDPDSDYVKLAMVKFTQSAYGTLFDFISEPKPVYESELLAPSGLFETEVDYGKSVSMETADTNGGFKAAVQTSEQIFSSMRSEIQTRRKILILATDAEFKDDRADANRGGVRDSLKNLRRALSSDSGMLDVYGIGVGSFYNDNNLRFLVDSTNGMAISCRTARLDKWQSYINSQPDLPVKSSFGERRPFYDKSLCCTLCRSKFAEGVEHSNCSAEEFSSSFTIINLDRLDCSSLGTPDECVITTTTSTTTAQTSTGTEDDHTEEDDEEKSTEMTFSALIVVFAVVNLVLLIMFILVCIFAHKLGPTKQPAIEEQQRQQSKQDRSRNQYSGTEVPEQSTEEAATNNGAPTPVIIQPPPQRQRRSYTKLNKPERSISQVVRNQDNNQADNDSGISEQGNNIYGNQLVLDILHANNSGSMLREADNDGYSWAPDEFDHSPEDGTGYVIPIEQRPPTQPVPVQHTVQHTDYSQIEENQGDYENVDFQPQTTYFDAFRKDFVASFQKFKRSSKFHNTDTEAGHAQEPPHSPGGLSQSVLQTTIPLPPSDDQTDKSNIRRKKGPSLFKELIMKRLSKSRSYENQDVIQNIHDNKAKKKPAKQGIDNPGMDTELQKRLKERKTVTDQGSADEAQETFGTDYVNENMIEQIRNHDKLTSRN